MKKLKSRTFRFLSCFIMMLAGISCQSLAATVMITGANSGIGLEFTKQYAAKGWDVIAVHRRSSVPESLAAVQAEFDNVQVETMDVTSNEQAAALAEKLQGVAIDVLINNAGVYNDRSGCQTEDCPGSWDNQNFGELDYRLLDTIMAVNVKGPLIVSEAFIEHIKASEQKKLVSISSSNGSITEDPVGPGAIFYRTSKAALNRAMQIVAASVKDAGVITVMFNPGPVLTERQSYLSEFDGMLETSFTVGNMISTIETLTIEDSGRFLSNNGETQPW